MTLLSANEVATYYSLIGAAVGVFLGFTMAVILAVLVPSKKKELPLDMIVSPFYNDDYVPNNSWTYEITGTKPPKLPSWRPKKAKKKKSKKKKSKA